MMVRDAATRDALAAWIDRSPAARHATRSSIFRRRRESIRGGAFRAA
jgi:hypothetical protein